MEVGSLKIDPGKKYLFILLEEGTEIRVPTFLPYLYVLSRERTPPPLRLEGSSLVFLLNFQYGCGMGMLFHGEVDVKTQDEVIKKEGGAVIGVVSGGELRELCNCNVSIAVEALQKCLDKVKDRP